MSASDGEEVSLIVNLPNLVLNKILRNLELLDKKTMRIVCRRWRRIFDDPDQMHYKFCAVVQSNSDAKFLMESYPALVSVYFGGVTTPLSGQKFPDIPIAVLGRNNAWPNIIEILTKGCQKAKSLKIDRYGFEKVCLKQISLITNNTLWEKLRSLELVVEVEGRGKSHAVAVELFLKSVKLAQISELSLSVVDEVHSKGMLPLFIEFYNFIARHSKKLKSLEIVFGNSDWTISRYRSYEMRPVIVLTISKSTESLISNHLKLTIFKVVHFNYSGALGLHKFKLHKCLVESVCTASSTLSKLHWCSDSYHSSLRKIIKKNETTLTELTCRGSYLSNPSLGTTLFRICPKLKLASLCVENFFGWKSSLLWDNLKLLKIIIMNEYHFGWRELLWDIGIYFNRLEGFKKIEIIKLYTPPLVYDVPHVREILGLADFKEFLFWSTSNENLKQIRTYCASIPDLIFTNKSCQYEKIYGWETTIKKNPNF